MEEASSCHKTLPNCFESDVDHMSAVTSGELLSGKSGNAEAAAIVASRVWISLAGHDTQ